MIRKCFLRLSTLFWSEGKTGFQYIADHVKFLSHSRQCYRSSLIRLSEALTHTSSMANAQVKTCDAEIAPLHKRECVGSKGDLSVVKEGKAEVLFPKAVFYNSVQEFNRDISIAVIGQFARDHFSKLRERTSEKEKAANCLKEEDGTQLDCDKTLENLADLPSDDALKAGTSHEHGLRIFEGLAATGLRSVRFGLEIPGVKEVIANDYNRTAVEIIQENIKRNNLEGIVRASYGDAGMVMYQNRNYKDRFDVIDLDPYGSPATFLDAAVQAIKDGGLLCVTCTDTAILCGNGAETCYSKYGSMSLRSKFCHEMALRIVLQCIESHANRYSRYIVPVLALSIDFYVRIFVKVYSGQGKVKQSVSKMAMIYHCSGCGSYELQKLGVTIPTKGGNFKYSPATGPPVEQMCRHCGCRHHVGGPIWADPMHDVIFVERVLDDVSQNFANYNTSSRILGMLNLACEELDTPLYYITDELCRVVHCVAPNLLQIRSAILNAGYRVSLSHATKNSLKTNAPNEVIWDIIRHWVKNGHPVKPDRLKEGTSAKFILDQEPTTAVSFNLHPDANPQSRLKGLVRYQVNPEKDWGPKARAKSNDVKENLCDKREKNQSKRSLAQDAEEKDLKQFPCKRFKRGLCEKGEDCRYSHDLDLPQDANNS